MADITVGICAHNEEETMGTLLEQISKEEIPIKEVIVAVAGDDSTSKIVKEKKKFFNKLKLIKEEKREGQISAQNKILSSATGDTILLIDGDGTIKPGSLEKIYENYNKTNIVSGRERPVTEKNFIGTVISLYGELHNEMCLKKPRFSTHLGIFPSELVEEFPNIVLDDSYVEHRAIEENIDIKYISEAVKYHNTPNTLRFFFRQQKKNWAGRFQVEDRGFSHSKSNSRMISTYLRGLHKKGIRYLPELLLLGAIEITAFAAGKYHYYQSDYPVKWWRPGSD